MAKYLVDEEFKIGGYSVKLTCEDTYSPIANKYFFTIEVPPNPEENIDAEFSPGKRIVRFITKDLENIARVNGLKFDSNVFKGSNYDREKYNESVHKISSSPTWYCIKDFLTVDDARKALAVMQDTHKSHNFDVLKRSTPIEKAEAIVEAIDDCLHQYNYDERNWRAPKEMRENYRNLELSNKDRTILRKIFVEWANASKPIQVDNIISTVAHLTSIGGSLSRISRIELKNSLERDLQLGRQ